MFDITLRYGENTLTFYKQREIVMKKVIMSLAAGSALLASGLVMAGGADDAAVNPGYHSGIYLGADVGYGGVAGDKFQTTLRTEQLDNTIKVKDSGVTAGAHIGYDFNQYFAAQVDYMYLPHMKVSGNTFLDTDVTSQLFGIAAKGQYSFMQNQASVFALAGISVVYQSIDGTDGILSSTNAAPYVGAGVEYRVMPKLGVSAQYRAVIDTSSDNSRIGGTVQMGLVGMNYYF